jgi:hypothetical protein
MNAIETQWLLVYHSHNEPFEFESDNETAEVEIDLLLSMQKKLARAIDKDINSKISSKSQTSKDVTSNE